MFGKKKRAVIAVVVKLEDVEKGKLVIERRYDVPEGWTVKISGWPEDLKFFNADGEFMRAVNFPAGRLEQYDFVYE